jgi:hypothetical protein
MIIEVVVTLVAVLAACLWAWHHFSLHRRLDHSGHRSDDDLAQAGREAMRAIDQGRAAGRGQFPV